MTEQTTKKVDIYPVRLKSTEGLKNLSPSLQNNPAALLVEKDEVERYFNLHPDCYLKQLGDFISQDGNWDKKSKKISICIPSCQEQGNIYRTLACFTEQSPELIDKTEILILDNHREGEKPDNTYGEVERFSEEHPELHVSYHYAVTEENVPFGSIRKALFDIALRKLYLSEGTEQGGNILVSCDADVHGVSHDYLSAISNGFNNNPDLDVLVGSFTYPEAALHKYPLLAAAYNFHRIYRIVNEVRLKNTPWSSGRTTAFSASIYTAVGGLDGNIMKASDIDFGRRVQAARKDSPLHHVRRGHFKVATDPRRVLTKMCLEDRCYSDEFEDKDWTRSVGVIGRSWTDYNLPSLEVVSTEGLEKEFSGILLKKAYRQGFISNLRDLTPKDVQGLDIWISMNRNNIDTVFKHMQVKRYSFIPQREININGHRIPQIVVLDNL